MPKASKVYVAAHRGLVSGLSFGKAQGYDNLVLKAYLELDLKN